MESLIKKIVHRNNDKLEQMEKDLLSRDGVIKFNTYSKPKSLTLAKNSFFKMGSLKTKYHFFKRIFPSIKRATGGQRQSFVTLHRSPRHPKTHAPASFIQELEKRLRSLGVDDIGYTKVPREYIFTGKGILYEHAIVVSMEMDKPAIDTSPGFDSFATVMKTYADLGEVVNEGADFLRTHGFGAQAGPALGGVVDYSRLAEKAGMGVLGRNGLLISDKFGPRHRLAAIYTSMENLPLVRENPHQWVRVFCRKCGNCTRKCPGGALYGEEHTNNAGQRVYVDADRCRGYFTNEYGCAVCIKECLFNKVGYTRLKERFFNQ